MTGGGAAVVFAPELAVLSRATSVITSKTSRNVFMCVLSLRCFSSEALDPRNPKFDPLNPQVESEMVERLRQLDEMIERMLNQAREMNKKIVEPRPQSPQPPSPPSPPPPSPRDLPTAPPDLRLMGW